MTTTVMPSVKGQITLPPAIRKKYDVSKETPIVIEDKGNGVVTLKIMKIVEHDLIEEYENDKEFGLIFKKGISAKALMKAIKKIDG